MILKRLKNGPTIYEGASSHGELSLKYENVDAPEDLPVGSQLEILEESVERMSDITDKFLNYLLNEIV